MPARRCRGQGPTHRQQARWHAIQAAQEQGMSVRKMAQVLGISRNTVRTYLLGNGPPSLQRTAKNTSTDGG
ncbi:MAG: helix-turn-helix domain-containing protein [Bacillota bacterium]